MQVLRLVLDIERIETALPSAAADVDGRVLVVGAGQTNCRGAGTIYGCSEICLRSTQWVAGGNVVKMNAVRSAV